jgi:hypothetical protein
MFSTDHFLQYAASSPTQYVDAYIFSAAEQRKYVLRGRFCSRSAWQSQCSNGGLASLLDQSIIDDRFRSRKSKPLQYKLGRCFGEVEQLVVMGDECGACD